MKQSELRKPVQKRAIEKKKQILECGFNLICEKGYHNLDCIEIAKASNVSTGTVYQYFKDKRDIFLQGLKNYSDSLLFPILEYKDKKITHDGLKTFFKSVIKKNLSVHTMSQSTHEEIMAMRHSDAEVNKIFQDFEVEATEVLVEILKNNNFKIKNINEKSHIIIGWMDSLCHELAYHKHHDLNYNRMEDIVVNSIVELLK
jgi:AcrR family transcriptional regulator